MGRKTARRLLENHPRFFDRIARARASLREGRGVKLEDVAGPKKPRARRG